MSGPGDEDRIQAGRQHDGSDRPGAEASELGPAAADANRAPPVQATGTAQRIAAALLLATAAAPTTLVLYLVLTLAGSALPVASAWLTKLIIDRLTTTTGWGTLLALAVGLAAAGVIAAVTPQLTRYLQADLQREVGLLAQDRLFSAIERFVGLRRFEDPIFLDRLRLAQQAGGMTSTQVVDGVLGIVASVVTILGFLGSLFILSPIMTILVLAAAVPTLLAELGLSRRQVRMLWTIGPTERREFFYNRLLSSVEAAKEVRLFGIGGFLRARMLADRRSANVAKRALDRRTVAIQTGLGLLSAVVAGAGLVWAVRAAQQGRLSVGDIAIFTAAVAAVQVALTMLAAEIAQAHQALAMFDHYLAVTAAGPDLPVAVTAKQLPPLRRSIEFRDVWFRYSDNHPWVLRGVNLNIPAGKSLALVGLNGAGKSTLVKLLCRLYDPTRGNILWDDVDIRDVNPADLRQRISGVFQDYMHYDMTAAENIALGDLSALGDRDRIEAAAQRAGIHNRLAELPRRYDTLLSRKFFMQPQGSENDTVGVGVTLSDGQWQRLALARAFLRDRRDLMILDEPSSGLDPEAEFEIHASLRRHRRDQTSLLISHRLSAMRGADMIAVLTDGQIVEEGDHVALSKAGGEYSRLFTLQASGYQMETKAVSP